MGQKKGTSIKALENIFLKGLILQRNRGLKRFWRLQKISLYALSSWLRRKRTQKRENILAPIAMAYSPTMECNLSCIGCYARDYPRDKELSLKDIDEMLSSAEDIGVFLMIITGGEPLIREGILEILRGHKRLLFLMITNGTLMTEEKARIISDAGNIITVVSIEGSREQTDTRRGIGVYDQVRFAMTHLQNTGALFGFSAMVTSSNFRTLSSDEFIEDMVKGGCALGFYTEYIPIGDDAQWDLVLEGKAREQFRERVLEIRRNKPIMVAHLPDDEYGPEGKCSAVMGGCVHINAQGYVEPCPFTHFAKDNIMESGLNNALRSQFLAQIRASEAVYHRGRLGCALMENRELLEDIATRTGAKSTDIDTIWKFIRKQDN